jgi:hypothetical protein
MARALLTSSPTELMTDSGSVLWSIIKGEQLEYPIIIDFLDNVTGYTFEAAVVEAYNIEFQTERPIMSMPDGIQNSLTVRLPVFIGIWDPVQSYNMEEVVSYNGTYYKLIAGVAFVDATAPDISPYWVETAMNIVYVQFPAALGNNYAEQPTVGHPVYGFFELRVTEPAGTIYQRTWKPVRGMVQILFSPTDVVPDIP